MTEVADNTFNEAPMLPDADMMFQHIHELFKYALRGTIEIAYTNSRGAPDRARFFDVGEAEEAAEFAAKMNAQDGVNVYVGAALRKEDTLKQDGRSSANDFLGSTWLWADMDDAGNAKAASDIARQVGARPNMSVITGEVPHTRAQFWWRISEEINDKVRLKAALKSVQVACDSDPNVVDVSRVMRLGGSIAWPHKEGRVKELTRLWVYTDDRPREYPMSQLERAFGAVAPKESTPTTMQGALGIKMSSSEFIDNILAGRNWHNNMTRWVARVLSRGLSDEEILLAAPRFTLPNYTVGQTEREMQVAIDTGRRKFGHVADGAASNPAAPSSHLGVADNLHILSCREFVDGFVAPMYLIDGIIQRRYCYSLTAPTGHGKTAVALLLAFQVALGRDLAGLNVKQGGVLILAGENADDVRARILLMADVLNVDVDAIPLRFIPHVFDIERSREFVEKECERMGDVSLVIVDTAAAYSPSDDENDNIQAGKYARVLRSLTELPGRPCVLVPCHPTKSASKENLLPRGGGAFLAEVDGNLTLWANGDRNATELSWCGKFRGPEFDPISFKMERKESDAVKDAEGRRMPNVVAAVMSDGDFAEAMEVSRSDENGVLVALDHNPGASIAEIAKFVGWISPVSGNPQKSRVYRVLDRLRADKLVEKYRGHYRLSETGKKEVVVVRESIPKTEGTF